MTESMDAEKFGQIAQKIDPGGRLLRVWDLTGGVSAQVTALEIALPDGGTKKVVVRRHGEADLRQNPRVAADEFRLLRGLQSAGVAAPGPILFDLSGEIFSTPCLVVEYVEGQTDFAPSNLDDFLLQFTRQLSRIHAAGPALDLSFLPEQETIISIKLKERPARLDDSIGEGRIRDVLESLWPLARGNPPALLHGD